jgi:hypothetical protein
MPSIPVMAGRSLPVGRAIAVAILALSACTSTPTPTPTPAPGPGCGHLNSTNADLPAPTFIDQTGLVSSCSSFDTLYSPVSPPAPVENIDDPIDRVLQIAWIGTTCDGDANVTFAGAGDRFTVTIDRATGSNCSSAAVRRVRLDLTEPVNADAVDLNDRAH